MNDQFNQEMELARLQGYLAGNNIQINQNIISSAKAHLFLSDLTNPDKGIQNGTESNNTK
jgi:hypothetical protein